MSRLALAAVTAALLVSGCSAYDARYEFGPRPLEVGHVLDDGKDRAASVLVTVVGVRKHDEDLRIPASVELRVRIDNESQAEARLDASTLRMFAANLVEFPSPQVPGGSLVVEPGSSGVATAFFPFPDAKIPGAFDLEGLSVRWTLEIDARRSTGSATFSRDSGDAYERGAVGFFGWGWGWGYSSGVYRHNYNHGHGHDHGRSGGRGRTPLRHPGARLQAAAPPSGAAEH